MTKPPKGDQPAKTTEVPSAGDAIVIPNLFDLPLSNQPFVNLMETVRRFSEPDVLAVLRGARVRSPKKAREKLRGLVIELESAARSLHSALDPVPMPDNVFDPTAPDVAAWTVVLALVAQDKVPLANIIPEYGAGVYALYYHGDHPAYAAVSGKETPLYVGKADPPRTAVADVRSHGMTLSSRLLDHRRQVMTVANYAAQHIEELLGKGLDGLRLEDFDCRKLACAPGVQLTAEARLINLFRPLWNSNFNVAYGISKHGDIQRKHPKSPWDVLHPGRAWATGLDENGVPFPNQDTSESVMARIQAHLPSMKIFDRQEDVISAVLRAFGQQAATADAETAERLAIEAEDSGILD
ncbi:MAG TPA: Eco29kI family restriction endonuclease [Acidiphilium sp.]|nr:Eco29kI family restriction endonuclease [Acidiphilium sp.]